MRRLAILVSPLLVVAGFVLYLSFRPFGPATVEIKGSRHGAEAVNEDEAGARNGVGDLVLGMAGPQTVFYSDAFYRAIMTGGVGSSEITVQSRELDPATNLLHQIWTDHGTSYWIQLVAPRHANELYVAGQTRNGDELIEKWTIPQQPGRYFTERLAPGTPIGVPVPPSTTIIGITGGVYVPPSGGLQTFPEPERREIYRGTALGGVLDMVVDPEGRFLLVLSKQSRSILRLPIIPDQDDITPYPEPEVLYTPAQIPFLSSVDHLNVFHHGSEGRKYILSYTWEEGTRTRVILHDPDNDGIFDSQGTYDEASYAAAGYDGNVWTENFVWYAPWPW